MFNLAILFLCGKTVRFASQLSNQVSSAFPNHSMVLILQVGCVSQDSSLFGCDYSRKEREARRENKPWDPVLAYVPLHRSHSNQSLLQTARGHFHLKGHFPSPQDSFGWNHCNFYFYFGSSMKAWRFSISLYNNKDLSLNLQSSEHGEKTAASHHQLSCVGLTDQHLALMLPPLCGVAGTYATSCLEESTPALSAGYHLLLTVDTSLCNWKGLQEGLCALWLTASSPDNAGSEQKGNI